LYFSHGFFVYSPTHVHVYIRAIDPQMNTSAIHNTVVVFVSVGGAGRGTQGRARRGGADSASSAMRLLPARRARDRS
jgi:hypothetical protein